MKPRHCAGCTMKPRDDIRVEYEIHATADQQEIRGNLLGYG